MNRLGDASSPYLRQHATNPVGWWPWGGDAFAEARRRDVPLLISIGYASCHWCHVMAHESFEDETIAALVNEVVVPVKVDREERPDVDAVYLTATRLMAGQAGWPMTVLATPAGEPFFCGTYLPPATFVQLLHAAADAWREQRDQVYRQGAAVVAAVVAAQHTAPAAPAGVDPAGVDPAASTGADPMGVDPVASTGADPAGVDPAAPAGADPAGVDPAASTGADPIVLTGLGPAAPAGMPAPVLAAAATSLLASFDDRNAGFGGAPKFPPHMELLFLLRHHQRTGDPNALAAVRRTCEAMARGGMADQIGGGFARYAVDATWTVPHFEKMLYDNALLLRVYTGLWRLTGDPLARRVAAGIVAFLDRALRTPEGGLAAALDADTDGVEGSTYVWTPQQLRAALGDADGAWATELFGVTDAGTFEHGTSVLRLPRDPDDPARFAAVLRTLAAVRAQRRQPAKDDKIVAAWNGLAVTALVEYAMTCAARPDPDAAGQDAGAVAAALAGSVGELLARVHLVGGRLRRVSLAGVVGTPAGVLDDYGCVAEAFCALHQLTGDGSWLRLATELLSVAVDRFADGAGGWFDTADDAEQLVARPADRTDNATPSGTSALAAALVAAAALTEQPHHRAAAEAALAGVAPLAAAHGRMTGYACAAAEALLAGPTAIAVATGAGRTDPLVRAAWRHLPPGAVVVHGAPDAPGVPLLAGRPMRGGAPTAYVCRGFVCDAPVTGVADLDRMLGSGRPADGGPEYAG